ncbi:MAG: M23 family metallopeptidase [Bacteroidales bacterium]|nr:M23 family metallopeptidase [Bacteroidales bacterium]
MKKKKVRFWHNVKFKYKLAVMNENTLEEVFSLHVSKLNGLSWLLAACSFIFLIAASIIVFTPLRNYLPGYINSELRQQVVTNALRADSLQEAIGRYRLYVDNLQAIFSGQVKADTVTSLDSLHRFSTDQLAECSTVEEEFVAQYEERERYNLTAVTDNPLEEGLLFCPPARGTVVRPFNGAARHYGIDLSSTPNSSITSVLDGTVILSAYTATTGYVIQVQHTHDFVSVYKYCGSLMKQEGDPVKAGEAIALTAPGEANQEHPHLHFELWHKGVPANPEKYIVF